NEVTRVAIASLIQRGLLRISEQKRGLSKTKVIDRNRQPSSGELSPIEAVVMKWSGFPAGPQQIFHQTGLPQLLKKECHLYQDELTERGLLAPPEMKELGSLLMWIGSLLILGLGGYKFAVALAKGHHNIMFLILVAVIGEIALSFACLQVPNASRL